MSTFGLIFGVACGVALGLLLFVSFMIWGHADRDSTDGARRSGMTIYVDAKTGIQYLVVPFGGMHVRLNKDGLPMTVDQDK